MQLEKVKQLNAKASQYDAQGIIKLINDEFGITSAFATSLGEEDQVITDMIAKIAPWIEVFTLDTGRLFTDSYDLIAKNQMKYKNLNFKIYYPDAKHV